MILLGPTFKGVAVALSCDQRTNVWRLQCPCGATWNPPTTMLAQQWVECPKCEAGEVVDYNKGVRA